MIMRNVECEMWNFFAEDLKDPKDLINLKVLKDLKVLTK